MPLTLTSKLEVLTLECIRSIPALERAMGDARKTASISESDTLTLITRIASTSDAIVLWAIHQELDRREIAPIFRYPKNTSTPQLTYLSWLADILWFTQRNTQHTPGYKAWIALFRPVSDDWHESAIRVYGFAYQRGYGATYFTKGLALLDADRRELMTIKSTRQIARMRVLRHSSEMHAALTQYAIINANRSGDRQPAAISRRRLLIWRTYVLADRSETVAARLYSQIYGDGITRQSLGKQIAAVDAAWRKFGTKVLS